VRVYHGKHTLPKIHVARMRISLPATSDYWVNDMAGDPLFVITADDNAGLVKMLPGILEEARALVRKRRVTVVFDRGGYSPKLFRQILASDFDLLTYRKDPYPRIPPQRFQERRTRRQLEGAGTTSALEQAIVERKNRLHPLTLAWMGPWSAPCRPVGRHAFSRLVPSRPVVSPAAITPLTPSRLLRASRTDAKNRDNAQRWAILPSSTKRRLH